MAYRASDRLSLRRLLLMLFLCSLAVPSQGSEPITGRASVIDGDTLGFGKQRVRLNGIDAPEASQICQDSAGRDYRCGKVAAGALDEWLARSRPTRCTEIDRDRYRRIVADCFRADGESVQRWLVQNGHALDWPRYSKGAFADDQAIAQSTKAGLWQGHFVEPWEVRKQRRASH